MEYLESIAEKATKVDTIQPKLSFVVFSDPNKCSLCELNYLTIWNTIEKKTNNIIPVKFYYIFSPSKEEHKEMVDIFTSRKFIQSIYIDYDRIFEKSNPKLNTKKYNSFLIDSKGKILYIGNPTTCRENEESLLYLLRHYEHQQEMFN